MGFSEETIASVRGDSLPEIGVLLAASAPAGSAPLPGEAGRAPDPDRLFDIARLNKMLGQLPVSPAGLPPGCAALAPRLLQVRLRIAAMNRRAMAVTAEASAALARAGLRHVVLKGPFQQMAVHGDPFRRPSGDIDLFVAPRDRRRAAAVLQALGFAAMEQEQALWWIPFLGEQHFRRDSDGAVIDLHHRLQQAGLPDWRGAAGVLDRAVTQTHEGVAIPVLSPADGCLLMDELNNAGLSLDRVHSELRAQGILQLGQLRRVYLESTGRFTLLWYQAPRPGLSLLPPLADAEPPPRTELLACNRCGHTATAEVEGWPACARCGNEHWEPAVT